MIAKILIAIGLVMAVEGLVLALAPRRIEEVLAFLIRMSVEQRRVMGLVSLAIGVILIWVVRAISG